MEEKIEKKPIVPILRAMEVGQVETYDIIQENAVRVKCCELWKEGLEFTVNLNRKNKSVTVTRTK